MPSRLKELVAKSLAHPPHNLENSIHYEVYMGSAAYGCSNDTSDLDIYGFAIAPKEATFPHLSGYVEGFGTKPKIFDTYQQHHIIDKSSFKNEVEYDYTIHSIAKYFNLLMGNNPNLIDSLFTPERCILHMTPIGQMVRENRRLFISKECIPKFKGYAFQSLHKLRTKSPSQSSKRAKTVAEFGFDLKYAYHIVRLLLEVEQLLSLGEMDLERDREVYKSIRRGEWTIEQIEEFFRKNEARLAELGDKSKLPEKADENRIKKLLLDCLEQHFGNLKDIVITEDPLMSALKEIDNVVYKLKTKGIL